MARPRPSVTVVRRCVYDREILRLALPALGALAAEPLYLLVDTAIVGHLGTPSSRRWRSRRRCSVVVGAVHLPHLRDDRARRAAARRRARRPPPALGAQALWLALAVGLARRGARRRARRAARRRCSAATATSPTWRRATCASPRSGCRGARRARGPGLAARHRRPAHAARHRGGGQRRQRRARAAVRLRLRLGPRRLGVRARCSPSSGWASRSPSCCCARRRARADPSGARSARSRDRRQLVVRTASLLLVLRRSPPPCCARIGAAALAAHQIAFQLFGFLALVLDAIAIAGQVHRRPRARRRRRRRGLRRRAAA